MLLFQHMFTANMASNLKLPQLKIAWPPLKSPCVREHISIVVQLAFLVLLLLQFVRKSVSRMQKQNRSASHCALSAQLLMHIPELQTTANSK
ncbi:hypothetical protein QYF36_004710 [Acer negundo]|nr:hypothetical protein QYF36_004710 [Acer negundo]